MLKRSEYRLNRDLKVDCDPLDPMQVVIRPGDFSGGVMGTVLGAVFVLVGAGLFLVGLNNPKQEPDT